MVKINWSVYLILGIGVLIASYRIDAESFKLFIWLGYLFLVVGVAKFVFWFITRKKESSIDKKELRKELSRGMLQGQVSAGKYCISCGSGLVGNVRFCPHCGQKQRMSL